MDVPLAIDRWMDNGQTTTFEYYACPDFDHLPPFKVPNIHTVALDAQGRMLLVYNKKGNWNLPGGHMEEGETFEQTLRRELIEEANVKMDHYQPLGYQIVYEPNKEPHIQLRAYTRVTPIGPFMSDPDESIQSIQWINPAEIEQYIPWGKKLELLIKQAQKLDQKEE